MIRIVLCPRTYLCTSFSSSSHENEEEDPVDTVKKIEESPVSSPSSAAPVVSRETWETLVLKGLRDAIRSKRMLFGESLANDTGDLPVLQRVRS